MANDDQTTLKGEQLLTIHRALDVLEYLSEAGQPVRLIDISDALGLTKSQIHRILSTLLSRKYVRQNPITRLYSLGFATWLLSRSMDFARTLVDIAKPVLDSLCHEVQETGFLSVLYGQSVLYLYTTMSPNGTHVFIQVGSQAPVHATASGKVILAHQPREYLDELFAQEDPVAYTQYTLVDKADLRRELDRIIEQGYALEDQENHIGMSAVATALPIGRKGEVAGVGLFLPSSRVDDHTLDYLIGKVLEARDEILQKMEGNR